MPRGAGAVTAGWGGLRTTLNGLTTRGRSFFAAGVAACLCACLLGQTDLLRVGVLLAALPLVCVALVRRSHHSVVGVRSLRPHRIVAGEEAGVRVAVDNTGRLPTGALMVQDRVPYDLGTRPRFVLDRISPGGRREVAYRLRADRRGRYQLGPLDVRLADPFGMCELSRPVSDRDTLTVAPRARPLPALRLTADAPGPGGRGAGPALSGADDVGLRGYRVGDDLRRIHWRSTARHGELMVRREEQPRTARGTVLLDTRAAAWDAAGTEAFEWAVEAAASVGVHLLGRGLSVRLMAGAPAAETTGWARAADSPAETAEHLLDTLAAVTPAEDADPLAAHDAPAGAGKGLLVALFGELDEARAAAAARAGRHAGHAIALVLEPRVWAGTRGPHGEPEQERCHHTLRAAGWRVVPVRPGDTVERVWQAADGAPAAPAHAAWQTGDGVVSGREGDGGGAAPRGAGGVPSDEAGTARATSGAVSMPGPEGAGEARGRGTW